jgi:hypothetical protein
MTEETILQQRKEVIEYFNSLSYNLDNIAEIALKTRQDFYNKFHELQLPISQDHAYLDLSTLINEMIASFIAPAYHLNSYIKNLLKDLTWDDEKFSLDENDCKSGIIRRAKYQADAQSIFLSIKMCLDRLVAIFTYYYKGISSSTTFGRYKDSGKATGLISKVNELKENDHLMAYIDENYHKWIKDAVSPQDVITHYNDLQIMYHFDSKTGFELPIHGSNKLLDSQSPGMEYGIMTLKEYTENWYDFFNNVMQSLLSKNLITEHSKI